MKVLAIIPARGGSKGIPRKNIRSMLGKSLVQRTFETVSQSKLLDRIILSTDDKLIADHGKDCGLDVPFIRPSQLASDNSPMIGVIFHALETLKEVENYKPDSVMILQPTSPLRKPEHIDKAIMLLKDNDAVCSLVQTPMIMSPYYAMKITDEGYVDYFLDEGQKIKRRQDVPKTYLRDGTTYLTTIKALYKYKDFYGNGKSCIPMLIPNEESLSIDTLEDWALAEEKLSK